MLASFSLSQSDSIQLLPLLFHVNHPMLPGYIDKSTPCGIPNYSPDKLINSIAKTISRSFKYQSRAFLKYEIFGLYLMGSAGTMGQSLKSDLDLWVCIDDDMSVASRDKLYRKTQKISEWFATRGVELNCYLVGQNDFKSRGSRNLTKESCGETQNYLLLDEFYRTAIWMCGRKPLWWIVPPNENYESHSARLLDERHLSWADWIDFGDVVEIPAAEYFSASLWQLYKSIESPYKSLLKLLLLEVYARHVDETGLLSTQFKSLVYDDDSQERKIDPYLLMLEYAEKFIQQPARLEFLRRAFYLKSGTKVQLGNRQAVGWRYKTLLEMVKGWGWKQERLDYLNQRGQWQINRVLKEREELVRELNHSYHFLANFARLKGVADQVGQTELLSLGRKLYSVFEKKPGKIEVINTGIVKDLTESTVTFYQASEKQWHLYLGAVGRKEVATRRAVFSAESYFMLVAWSVCNHIANVNTNIQVFSLHNYLNQNFIYKVFRQLLNVYQVRESVVDDQVFQNPAMTSRVSLFLNTLVDPLEAEKQAGIYSIADQLDHFCWGESQSNLLRQFESFTTNTWGENVCRQYQGSNAWIRFFQDNREIINDIDERFDIFSSDLPQASALARRIKALLTHWNQLYSNSLKKNRQYRYLMPDGKNILRINLDAEGISYQRFENREALFKSLGESSNKPFEWIVDEYLALPDFLTRILHKNNELQLSCYLVRSKPKLIEIFVKDEHEHIFYQQSINSEPGHLVNYFQQFFDAINVSSGFVAQSVDYVRFWYADVTDPKKTLRFQRIKPDAFNINESFWNVRATASLNSDGEVCFDLSLAEQSFCYQDYGELVYRKMAQAIKARRQSGNEYSVYLSDLDLSSVTASPDFPTYFRFKNQVERSLSQALELLGG